jgi:spermidine synthase
VVNRDALIWLEEPGAVSDVALIDFPDPHSFALGKLYATRFSRRLRGGAAAVGVILQWVKGRG